MPSLAPSKERLHPWPPSSIITLVSNWAQMEAYDVLVTIRNRQTNAESFAIWSMCGADPEQVFLEAQELAVQKTRESSFSTFIPGAIGFSGSFDHLVASGLPF